MTPALRDRIAATVADLEHLEVAELTRLLAAVGRPSVAGEPPPPAKGFPLATSTLRHIDGDER
jgi:hypothetical protein